MRAAFCSFTMAASSSYDLLEREVCCSENHLRYTQTVILCTYQTEYISANTRRFLFEWIPKFFNFDAFSILIGHNMRDEYFDLKHVLVCIINSKTYISKGFGWWVYDVSYWRIVLRALNVILTCNIYCTCLIMMPKCIVFYSDWK